MTDTTVTTDAVAPVRIDSASIDERVRDELLQIAGFSDLRAQDQALLCYRALGRYGVIAPSWTRVREIIGKGSSNSISQAQKIFLAELGKFLTSAREIDASVPRAVADSFAGLWRDAIDHARQAFDGQTREWKDQIMQAEAARDAAEQARAEAVTREQSLLARIQGLDGIVKSLQEQLSTLQENSRLADQIRTMAAEQTAPPERRARHFRPLRRDRRRS